MKRLPFPTAFTVLAVVLALVWVASFFALASSLLARRALATGVTPAARQAMSAGHAGTQVPAEGAEIQYADGDAR